MDDEATVLTESLPQSHPPVGMADELQLIAKAASGDRAAFGTLVSDNYDRIYRFAYHWMGDRQDAEDVAQDACVKLARSIGQFKGRSAFSSWLYRIVLSTAHDHLRRRVKQQKRTASLEIVHREIAAPEDDTDEDLAEMWTAIRRLPDKQRDAMLLVYGQDLSHAEAASVLECSEKTVSWHLHEGRKRLKRMIEA